MDSFNAPVDFAGLAINNDDVPPIPSALAGMRLSFALAAAGTSSGLFLSPSLLLASGSTGGGG
jgi:hypothetical protein